MAKPNIDISLDGVGESARSAKTKRASIDIPLDGEKPPPPGDRYHDEGTGICQPSP